MESLEKKIQEIAEDLILNKKIDLFLGYEKADIPLMSRPYFINAAEKDSGKLKNSIRSEEHTSELQSHSFISYAVFCLKKKIK